MIRANPLKPGKSCRASGYGIYSTAAAAPGNETFTFKLGSTLIANSGGFGAATNRVNAQVSFDLLLTCLTSEVTGTIEVQARLFNEPVNGGGQWFTLENTGPIPVTTTIYQPFKLTFQFAASARPYTIHLLLLHLEELG